jgi:hypothetical protein
VRERSQVALTDKRAAEVHGGLMQLGAALPSQSQAAEEVQPGEAPFDHPPQATEAGAVFWHGAR